MSPTYCIIFTLLLSLALHSASMVSASHFDGNPRLGIPRDVPGSRVTAESVQTFYFNQTLDHFSYRPDSYTTFKQKYAINDKYWGGPNTSAPIFAYLGAEGPIGDIPYNGFLTDNAPQFNALIVYIEHRFYGDSVPDNASDPDTRGNFNSAQALADYAAVIVQVKQDLAAEKSPVIVIGGSYGGMLASWFRLKYPHIAIGALASSAPILLPVNFTVHYGYYQIVSKDFLETSESCYKTINASWEIIDEKASEPGGLENLTETFRTCQPLKGPSGLKNFLISMYSHVAQYDDPYTNQLAKLCAAIDSAPSNSSILSKIFAGVVEANPNCSCYDVDPSVRASQPALGWTWQICSDIMMPFARDNTTMFQPGGDTLRSYIDYCKSYYGVDPRPHWVFTYYGGQDIKLILKRFGSNIIFSNGLKDPYSDGGVLEDISDTIRAVYTKNGSHCLDILGSTEGDPDWLTEQRKTEVKIMQGWIDTYYNDLMMGPELLADGASRVSTS